MAQPHEQPPSKVDWTKWEAPGEGDVRSPCPCINALANHGILPRNGKAITKEMAVKALTTAVNLDSKLAAFFATAGVSANPDHAAHSFDLNHTNKHNIIEHDVSLSRQDIALGSNSKFDKAIFEGLIKAYGDTDKTSYAAAGKARYARVQECKEAHQKAGKVFNYGMKEAILSYGESALYLNVLGNDGVAPLEWVKILFEEERFPYNEGWRPPVHPIDQTLMNKAIYHLVSANDHKSTEAREVGVGTVQGLVTAAENFIKAPSFCTVM